MRAAIGMTLGVMVASLLAPATARADFLLNDDDRVLIYGGREADPASFSMHVEAYVRVRYPQLGTWFLQEQPTPRGTVTEGLAQYEERVALWKPTVVVLCFGLDDAGEQAFSEDRLAPFDADLRQLVSRCRADAAKVWLMTPLCPDTDRFQKLREIQYDECVGRYAEAIRTIGKDLTVPVIDWYRASVDRRTTTGNKPRLRLTSLNGIDPTPLGSAVATELVLDAWKAEPLRFVIRADWVSQEAEVAHGSISAKKRDENTLVLSLKDIPLAWFIPNRGGLLASDWPPSRFYEYMLQVDNIPDGGFIVGLYDDGRVRNGKPFLGRQMLREGWDVSGIGPLAQPQATAELYDAIAEKNSWYRKVRDFRKRPVPDPEFKQAYATQALAFQQYADGTARIMLRKPRTTSLDIGIQTAQAAADDARKAGTGETGPGTTTTRPPGTTTTRPAGTTPAKTPAGNR